METNFLLMLLILGLFATTLADGSQVSPKCPDVHLPSIIHMSGTCNVTHHCSRVVCTAKESWHSLTIILQIDRCHDPLTANVSLIQPSFNLDWSHRFRDGKQAPLPVTPGLIPGLSGITYGMTMFLKVKLKKTGGKVNFTMKVVGEIVRDASMTDVVDVSLLEGQNLPFLTQDCPCPDVHFPKNFSNSCDVRGPYCSNVVCSVNLEGHPSPSLAVEIDRCHNPLTATVYYERLEFKYKWSHRFRDGEQTPLRFSPGNIPVRSASAPFLKFLKFVKITLKKTGGKVNFTLELVGEITRDSNHTDPVDVTLLEGQLPLFTQDCEERPTEEEPRIAVCYGAVKNFFDRMSLSKKIFTILGAVFFIVVLATVIVHCRRKRRGRSADQLQVKPPSYDEATSTQTKLPMQPLVNEV